MNAQIPEDNDDMNSMGLHHDNSNHSQQSCIPNCVENVDLISLLNNDVNTSQTNEDINVCQVSNARQITDASDQSNSNVPGFKKSLSSISQNSCSNTSEENNCFRSDFNTAQKSDGECSLSEELSDDEHSESHSDGEHSESHSDDEHSESHSDDSDTSDSDKTESDTTDSDVDESDEHVENLSETTNQEVHISNCYSTVFMEGCSVVNEISEGRSGLSANGNHEENVSYQELLDQKRSFYNDHNYFSNNEIVSNDSNNSQSCLYMEQSVLNKSKRKRKHQKERTNLNSALEASHPDYLDTRSICTFYMRGKCRKGDECEFSHNATPLLQYSLCKFFLRGECTRGVHCHFMHSEFPCKFYHTGRPCFEGEKNRCRFTHGPELSESLRKVLFNDHKKTPDN